MYELAYVSLTSAWDIATADTVSAMMMSHTDGLPRVHGMRVFYRFTLKVSLIVLLTEIVPF